jgi:hypothetical protein
VVTEAPGGFGMIAAGFAEYSFEERFLESGAKPRERHNINVVHRNINVVFIASFPRL